MEKYESYLRKTRKINGDYRLDKTIEKYLYYIKPYFDEIQKINTSDELIVFMNREINQRQANILYHAFRIYLQFRGYDLIDDEIIFTKLRKPNKKSTAFSSVRNMQSKVITKEEFKLLIEEAEDLTFKTAIAFTFDLGCRVSELINLKFGDLKYMSKTNEKDKEDLDAGIFAHVKLFGKGGKHRIGYLHKLSYTYLYKLVGGSYSKEDKIFTFTKNNGKPYDIQDKAFRDKLETLSIKVLDRKVTPHMGRHSFCTWIAENGAPASMIQNLMGHSDISTSAIYIKNTNKIGHDGMKKMGDILKNV